jgi:PAS domain-containing protein
MTKSLSDTLRHLADHAASLNEKVLYHILKMGVIEARNKGMPAPLPVLGIWDWDLTSDLAYLDPTCASMFGVAPRKGVPSSAWMSAIHPDDVHSVSDEIRKTLKVGGAYQFEYRLIVNDRVKWILSKGYCTLDKSNRPERFPGAILEISTSSATKPYSH